MISDASTRPKDVSAESPTVLPHVLPDMGNVSRRQLDNMTPNTGSQWLPNMELTDGAPDQNREPETLPKHETQTDIGLGTPDKPINNNCQTTTLKNVFHFFGMDSQSGKVNGEETQLLNDIRDQHGKGIDKGAIDAAFKNDSMSASHIKNAVEAGQLDKVFTEDDVTIKDPQGHKDNNAHTAASPELATLFLSEMGAKPEQQRLGTKEAADKVQAALDSGKPVMLGDQNTHTLLERATTHEGEKLPPAVQGHVYMAYKKNGQYYVADPSCPAVVRVPDQALQNQLLDANSTATIINAPPDPDKFLQH